MRPQVLEVTEPKTSQLREAGVQLGPWCVPQGGLRDKQGGIKHVHNGQLRTKPA